jgi:hypothetical protein
VVNQGLNQHLGCEQDGNVAGRGRIQKGNIAMLRAGKINKSENAFVNRTDMDSPAAARALSNEPPLPRNRNQAMGLIVPP